MKATNRRALLFCSSVIDTNTSETGLPERNYTSKSGQRNVLHIMMLSCREHRGARARERAPEASTRESRYLLEGQEVDLRRSFRTGSNQLLNATHSIRISCTDCGRPIFPVEARDKICKRYSLRVCVCPKMKIYRDERCRAARWSEDFCLTRVLVPSQEVRLEKSRDSLPSY